MILEDEEPGFREFNTAARYENVVARGIDTRSTAAPT